MNFLNNLILWCIPVVVLVLLLLIWRARVRRLRILKSLLGIRWNDPEHILLSPARRSLRLWLFSAGILLLMLAIARPYWGSQLVPYDARGRDVMILFDVSKSMLSEDIQPSRLNHAKWLLRQLVNDSNGDRFGLVAFAGNAFLECPMTTDKASFIQYVDELSTSSIPLGGTNLQLALETAVKAFDAAESANRAIVLITDGDELAGDSTRVLASLKNQKIPLFIIGLGDPANPAVIPIKRGPGETPAFMRDATGNLVKTKLNEQQLIKLSQETSGIYVRSTVTDSGLEQIRQRIKELVPKDLDKGIRTRPIERFYYPLGAALALLLIWFMLSERKISTSSHRKALLLFLLTGLLIAASYTKAAEDDSAATNDTTPPAANNETTTIQEKKSSQGKPGAVPNAVMIYNEGYDLQLKKDENAAKLYEQSINLAEKNPAVRARAYQNLGVLEHNKARQEMMQSDTQVKGQNLDAALEKLSGAEKILDKAEEMYVKSMSIKNPQPDTGKSADDSKDNGVDKVAEKQQNAAPGNIQLEQNRTEVAIDQQKLLFDREMIAELRKKIEELKKKQEEARKKTEEARKQQQQEQNKQEQNKQEQNKQEQNKQEQNKQEQNKQELNKQEQNKQEQNKQELNKQELNKQEQNKQELNKQELNKQEQNKQEQNKQEQNKQEQLSGKNQQQNAKQAMKAAQKAVDDLKDQAAKLDQKKIEQNAEAARKELDKAEQAGKESKQEKADKHFKEALKYLGADDQNKNDKDKNGGNDKDKKDKKNKNDKKNQDKQDQQDQQNQQDKQDAQMVRAKAAKQEKEIDPQQAKALLEIMAGKEKNMRDALKEQQQKMYGQIKVEKDW